VLVLLAHTSGCCCFCCRQVFPGRRRTMPTGAKMPCCGLHLKYLIPCNDPSCRPTGSSNSTPHRTPDVGSISPKYRRIPTLSQDQYNYYEEKYKNPYKQKTYRLLHRNSVTMKAGRCVQAPSHRGVRGAYKISTLDTVWSASSSNCITFIKRVPTSNLIQVVQIEKLVRYQM
jgi:hypothetical protein